MPTRVQLHSVANAIEPLQRMLYLPFPHTTMLEDAVIMAAESVEGTRQTQEREAAIAASKENTSLQVEVPERVRGSILTATA